MKKLLILLCLLSSPAWAQSQRISDTVSALTSDSLSPSDNYHFAGCAFKQINGDLKFYDLSGNENHGSFGTNLSNANAWANDNFVSTVDPTGGATDSVVRIPNVNFDYTGGEKLIFWWLGRITAEGSDGQWIGDGDSATYHGVSLRAKTGTQKMQLILRDGTAAAFGGTSTDTVADGNLHSFGLVVDGTAKKYGYWVDGVFDTAFGGNYLTFNSGAATDTRNSNTFNIGQPQPASASSTAGIATKTGAFHLIRLSATETLPTVAAMTNMFEQLRADPCNPINGSAF